MELFLAILMIIGIGLFDSLDPLPFIVIIGIMSKEKWLKNLLFFIVPYWFIYFLFGVSLFLIGHELSDDQWVDTPYFVQALNIIGIFLIVYGIYIVFKKDYNLTSNEEDNKLSSSNEGWKYFFLSIGLIISNLPFSYPYFGVISEMLNNEVSITKGIVFLYIYSVAFMLPYLFFVWAYKKYEDKAKAVMDKIIHVLTHRYVLGGIFILLGSYLWFYV